MQWRNSREPLLKNPLYAALCPNLGEGPKSLTKGFEQLNSFKSMHIKVSVTDIL